MERADDVSVVVINNGHVLASTQSFVSEVLTSEKALSRACDRLIDARITRQLSTPYQTCQLGGADYVTS